MTEWRWPNFTPDEMRCQHCGAEEIVEEHMDMLQAVRTEYGKPMAVTSGYRCKEHPIERRKARPGEHATGRATDVFVPASDLPFLTYLWYKHGGRRVGWNPGRFLHLGSSPEFPEGGWIY